MIKKALIFLSVCLISFSSYAQNVINIIGTVNPDNKSITISQTVIYKNTSDDTLKEVYLSNWNNSYSTKSTALAKRFEEEFSTKFHLAKDKQRSFTTIESVIDKDNNLLESRHLKNQIDILKVNLKNPLKPNTSFQLKLKYTIVLPDAIFTDY